ncbi:MAG: efflux transporter periplasmic adaptor subunit [Bacteroidales bacterium 36-12]|nr:MAG: efflux transporter periplasmic adaptor subunit [Bacteroidales bacterium 36-12]
MKSNKAIIYLLTGLSVVIATCILLHSCKSKKETENKWVTAQVSRQDISNLVTCTGSLEPISKVDVGTQVSGRVEKIYVDFNSIVKKGDLLAELDQTVLAASLASAQSSMASAKSQLDYQQKNYERYKTLYEKQLVSSSEFESAEYSYQTAKNNYDVSRNSYQTAKTNLSYAKIYSPIDGVVLSREVEEGQTVAASFSTPTLFNIANDLTKMRVIANVDEADIGNVREGQRATFTVDAYPTEYFNGDVTEVRQSATTTNNVVTYEVVINAPNPDLKLKPGLTATVSIYTLEKNNVLTIPSEALSFSPQNETRKSNTNGNVEVWVLDGVNMNSKLIQIGSKTGTLTEVISGLSEGENVVLKGEVVSSSKASDTKSDTVGNGSSSPFMPQPPKGRSGGGPR